MREHGNVLLRPILFAAFVLILTLSIGWFADRGAQSDPELNAKLDAIRNQHQSAVTNNNSLSHKNSQGTPAPSVAILPFQVQSNGADDQYFGDGFTQELIRDLMHLEKLAVTDGHSSFRFRGGREVARIAANALDVDHIVTGTLSREASRLKIDARLEQIPSGNILWSHTWDQAATDSFTIRMEIALNISAALGDVPTQDDVDRLLAMGIKTPEAFITYQKGLELVNNASDNSSGRTLYLPALAQANLWFERATDIEPGLISAWVHHAEYYAHILMASASGELIATVEASDIDLAPDRLGTDLQGAINNADDPTTRLHSQADLLLLEGKFDDLASLIDPSLMVSGCSLPRWIHLVSSAFARADVLHDASAAQLACDPFAADNRARMVRNAIRAGLWNSVRQTTAAVLTEEMTTPDRDVLTSAFILGLVQERQFDEAARMIRSGLSSNAEILIANTLVAAGQGQAGQTAEYQDQYLNSHGPSDRRALVFAAWRGDRNDSNHLAGRMDARKFGHLALLQAIEECHCGAPFDLESAPSFAAFIAVGQLPWPPADSIAFPLKNW